MPSPSRQIKVAAVQAEPEWLDLEATVNKTCTLVAQAASNGAQLVAFPECWIPGYPAWIWSRGVDTDMFVEYARNSLQLDSPQMRRIQSCAAENSIIVVLSFSENSNNSLYISQCTMDADGTILMTRRKLKPTHMERTVFGDASGDCLDNTVDTAIGRVGALACWEHAQPLLKYHSYSQREAIHVAAWPPLFEHSGGAELWSMSRNGGRAIARTYALESQSFVIHTTAIISDKGIEKMKTKSGALMNTPGGGGSAIFGPDGRQLSTDLPETEEGHVYATLDFDDIIKTKMFLDVHGHYSRPDMLWLGVDKGRKEHVRGE